MNVTGNLFKAVILIFALLFAVDNAYAQFTFFGKNRVQYSTFDWRIIQSDHFDIYYYDSKNYYLAEFSANALEAAYWQLSQDFRHQIHDRIKVIIYDSHTDFSQTNVVPLPVDAQGIGGVTDKFKNRITIPFQGDYGDYRRVLHHELLHAMINDMYYGGNIQTLVSGSNQLFFPLWFEEGLAEYTALGWDTNTDMFIRDAVINTYLPPIRQLGGYFAYRGGQAMWNFIVEEYGREKIGEIMQRIKNNRNIDASFRQSIGLSIDELSERFHDHLRQRYWPEVAERENLKNIGTHLTKREGRGGSYNTSPAISPLGDRIAMITNRRGYFDVVVISAFDGRMLKTLIRGEDNVDFEELNILNPNLAWSPDGSQIALSSRSRGQNDISIVDYSSGNVRKIQFPSLDAIGSVAWSPDGKLIAFQGNRGPFVDVYLYNLETQEFTGITNDVFSDSDPAFSPDSRYVYFTSDRGDRVQLNTYRTNYNVLANPNINQTDIFRAPIDGNRVERMTNTPGWSENRPLLTNDGRMIYISDQNGISNIYVMDLDSRESRPLTDLVTGVMQMSLSRDGSKLAVNSINGGYLDIFLINDPFSRVKDTPLSDNYWAERRARESEERRVPAIGYGRQTFGGEIRGITTSEPDTTGEEEDEIVEVRDRARTDEIDFRNYVFGDTADEEIGELLAEDIFTITNNKTDDGRFIPTRYRLNFSLDYAGAGGGIATGGYGTFASAGIQLVASDVLGDHQLGFSSNLVLDLRNSSYSMYYGYFANRTNITAQYFHSAFNFQQFLGGPLSRIRFYGGGVTFSRPINKFERIEFSQSLFTISLDQAGFQFSESEREYLFYPQLSYVRDKTRPGFITPWGGSRMMVSLTGGVPFSDQFPGFVSLSADVRKYIGIFGPYVIALRATGAFSEGPNPQKFYLGGMQNWINFRQDDNISLLDDDLKNIFISPSGYPMRGYGYFRGIGEKYTLMNAEFRFPLFAAILPGPIPIIPLYNIQGVAFYDVGSAWNNTSWNNVRDNLLMGTGFGLRTILLGLPVRYDLAWPYDVNEGSFGRRVHYFSIGIDF
jgi:Tol biopolymer transport system component